jgi:putative lipoic acid-binding regulatory protein
MNREAPPGAPPAEGGDGAAPDIMQFPMDFPVKVMGRRADGFADQVVAIVRSHAPGFDPATLEMRVSRNGNYLSLTATIRAESRPQLDALYRELTGHPMVSIVL